MLHDRRQGGRDPVAVRRVFPSTVGSTGGNDRLGAAEGGKSATLDSVPAAHWFVQVIWIHSAKPSLVRCLDADNRHYRRNNESHQDVRQLSSQPFLPSGVRAPPEGQDIDLDCPRQCVNGVRLAIAQSHHPAQLDQHALFR